MNVVVAEEPGVARRMTSAELRELGISALVYLRVGTMDGDTVYAVHAADGTRMAVVEDIGVAVEFASEFGLAFVAVH